MSNIRETDILSAFEEECPKPTPSDVSRWCDTFPDHAVAIRRVAAALLEINILQEIRGDRNRDDVVDTGWGEVDAHYAREPTRATRATMPDLLKAAHTDVPAIARSLDIGRDVLGAIFDGMLTGLPSVRLMRPLAQELGVDTETVAASIIAMASNVSPSPGEGRPVPGVAAKAAAPSGQHPRSWSELVHDSYMSKERKGFWLGDD